MSILSLQSHVAYGYVGNKAAVFPLQSMGYDVWPIHTVQFSNHTGYGAWQGEVFSAAHIENLARGLEERGLVPQCRAILTGYMGSRAICEAVARIAARWKAINPDILYLCDPVIGNTQCFVAPEVLDFFKSALAADIVTPNAFEAETLSGLAITDRASLTNVARHFHAACGARVVVITGLKLQGAAPDELQIFASAPEGEAMVSVPEIQFAVPVNGTGDLFSALFLGAYLVARDAGAALAHASACLQKVLLKTKERETRELQVLAGSYALEGMESSDKYG